MYVKMVHVIIRKRQCVFAYIVNYTNVTKTMYDDSEGERKKET